MLSSFLSLPEAVETLLSLAVWPLRRGDSAPLGGGDLKVTRGFGAFCSCVNDLSTVPSERATGKTSVPFKYLLK